MSRDGDIGIAVFVSMLILVSGCVSNNEDNTMNISKRDLAISQCTMLCENLVESGEDLTNGPCLSDKYGWNVTDWVCDIAHKPRIPIDNDPLNQCQAYREGNAHHFVELTPTCDFIRAI